MYVDSVLAAPWLNPGLTVNPLFNAGCDACLIGKDHAHHDKRAFDTAHMLSSYDEERAIKRPVVDVETSKL